MPSFDPIALGADCAHCPFAKNGRPQHPVAGEGPKWARSVWIGEGPGEEEVKRGRPFVGWTGKLLDRLASAAHLTRASAWVDNATCCRPTRAGELARRKATVCCRPRLERVLRGLKAVQRKRARILALGTWALFSLTRIQRIDSARGFVRPHPYGTLIATIHPARTHPAREPRLRAVLALDLARFRRLERRRLRPGPTRLRVNPRDGARRLEKLIAIGRRGIPIAFDIETGPARRDQPWTAKLPRWARLRTIGVGTKTRGYSFSWPPESATKTMLKILLGDRRIVKVGQNCRWFDEPILKRYGLEVR